MDKQKQCINNRDASNKEFEDCIKKSKESRLINEQIDIPGYKIIILKTQKAPQKRIHKVT